MENGECANVVTIHIDICVQEYVHRSSPAAFKVQFRG